MIRAGAFPPSSARVTRIVHEADTAAAIGSTLDRMGPNLRHRLILNEPPDRTSGGRAFAEFTDGRW